MLLIAFFLLLSSSSFSLFPPPNQFGRVSTYIAMNHVVASVMGPAKMAAQQIMLSVFYAITPISDSLCLTAQSFVPELAESAKKSPGGAEDLKTFNNKALQVGIVFGAIQAALVSLVPAISFLFTQDKLVKAQVSGTKLGGTPQNQEDGAECLFGRAADDGAAIVAARCCDCCCCDCCCCDVILDV